MITCDHCNAKNADKFEVLVKLTSDDIELLDIHLCSTCATAILDHLDNACKSFLETTGYDPIQLGI